MSSLEVVAQDPNMSISNMHHSQVINISLYSLIGDCFMVCRLIKDFKSDVMFSAGFDYDIGTYYT